MLGLDQIEHRPVFVFSRLRVQYIAVNFLFLFLKYSNIIHNMIDWDHLCEIVIKRYVNTFNQKDINWTKKTCLH